MGRKGTKASNRINSTYRNTDHEAKKENTNYVVKKGTSTIGRKVMIVVDSSLESKNALQWALTHTVQSHDMVILLYVRKNSKPGGDCNKEKNSRVFEFLSSMKNMCQVKRPEVNVEVVMTEDKEKGPAIVQEAKRRGVALLILGKKKRSITWRLVMIWAKNRIAADGGVVDYCIQNASCLAVAVRRKSNKVGGYLITTKRQKDFWLLA